MDKPTARNHPLCSDISCCRCRLPESVCRRQKPIPVAASGVANLLWGVYDSHRAGTISLSAPASQNRISRLSVCCAWSTWPRSRGEHPRPQRRYRQPALARAGTRPLAAHNRRARLSGCFRDSCVAQLVEKGRPPRRLANPQRPFYGSTPTEMN